MVNDLPIQFWNDEVERNAYNAAFYELGFRWHWDSPTYHELVARIPDDAAARIRDYLKTRQPHLLRAYDADFLVEVIRQKQAEHRQRGPAPGAASGHFDWATAPGAEVGA